MWKKFFLIRLGTVLSNQSDSNQRRKAQNRVAQRALRKRKDQLLEALQSQLKLAEEEIKQLQTENEELTRLLRLLQDDNSAPCFLSGRRRPRPEPDHAQSPAGPQGRHKLIEYRWVVQK
jgi:hypothetical protein